MAGWVWLVAGWLAGSGWVWLAGSGWLAGTWLAGYGTWVWVWNIDFDLIFFATLIVNYNV